MPDDDVRDPGSEPPTVKRGDDEAPTPRHASPLHAPRAHVAPMAMGEPSIHAAPSPRRGLPARFLEATRDYFLGDDLAFGVAVVPLCFLSMLLFTRHPMKTNFIFDEQEALLANPYVRSVADPKSPLHWLDAFRRDFWGLPADRSIGSYRPIPDLVWRGLWAIGARDQTPFLHHWVNVLLHGVNGAMVALIVQRLTRDRLTAWLAGALFTGCAVLTEAVSGVVGIADVLGGTGALLALLALALRTELMMPALFAATLFGLFSKESALCIVPLVPFAALAAAPLIHPTQPRAAARAGMAALATTSAFVLYVELRRRLFPAPLAHELSDAVVAQKHGLARVYAELLRWYAQPALPHDPLNNPLVNATPILRVAAALRIYVRGLAQIVIPWPLSGDYSAPQEPIPDRPVFFESVLGAILFVAPLVVSAWLVVASWLRAARRAREAEDRLLPGSERASTLKSREVEPIDLGPAIAVALTWIVVSYFPVSNVPVVLPTVRAERFWYFPAIATSFLLALAFARVIERTARASRAHALAWGTFLLFFVVQGVAARRHANDYTDDLAFWDGTRKAVPRSAKAHLNYSVMLGARGNLEARRASNLVALELAPDWPMANIYLGDTLCRMHKPAEAWPHYARGFELAPNDINLVALAVQCLWDEHALDEGSEIRDELEDLAEKHAGMWLDFVARDTIANGAAHGGVDPRYRPRGYNEGPKPD